MRAGYLPGKTIFSLVSVEQADRFPLLQKLQLAEKSEFIRSATERQERERVRQFSVNQMTWLISL